MLFFDHSYLVLGIILMPIFHQICNLKEITKTTCPKCGHNEAYWILRQMRGSDEPESRFYTCVKCNYKWRED